MNKGHWSYGRSSLALDIKIRKEHLKEFLMSQREMRKYWNEPRGPLYGPLSCFSLWLKMKKWKRKK